MYKTWLYDILAHSGAIEVPTEAPKGPLGALEVLGGPWTSLEELELKIELYLLK